MTTEGRRLTPQGQGQVIGDEISIFSRFPEDEVVINNSSELLDPNSLRQLQKSLKATMHEKRRKVLANADYAFTGSFYNVHRNIMNFDPLDLLPKFSGITLAFLSILESNSQLMSIYHDLVALRCHNWQRLGHCTKCHGRIQENRYWQHSISRLAKGRHLILQVIGLPGDDT